MSYLHLAHDHYAYDVCGSSHVIIMFAANKEKHTHTHTHTLCCKLSHLSEWETNFLRPLCLFLDLHPPFHLSSVFVPGPMKNDISGFKQMLNFNPLSLWYTNPTVLSIYSI